MKLSAITVTASAVTVLLVLAGCSSLSPESSAEGPAAPAIDPGPVELTVEEAGERYLNIVCPNNFGLDAIEAAFKAGEEEYRNGGAPDPAAVIAAAATLAELNRAAVEHFDDEYFIWPSKVTAQIPHMRANYMGELTTNQAVATSATYEDAYNVPLPAGTPEIDTAGQEIRYQLGLPSDTVTSCVGHEDGLTVLANERAEREAALAKQE